MNPVLKMVVHGVVASVILVGVPATTTAPSFGTERAAPQVTREEYKKVKVDMSKNKVASIVGSAGKVYSKGPECLIKQYSAAGGKTAYFRFQSGRLYSKQLLFPEVQGGPLICVGPM